jgi:predicted O-methyltransferase YrrM
MTVTLNEILAEAPKFHLNAAGQPVSWGLAEEVLRYIAGYSTASMRTLEIGAGFSTLVFALSGSSHTVIVPDEGQVEKIQSFASQSHIDLTNVDFRVDYSQVVLPQLEQTALDLVLIDGDHAFPAPFIDWYYAAIRMRPGARMIVDDTHLWTGKILHGFLSEDPGWRLDRKFRRTSVFEMIRPLDKNESWVDQRFVARRSPTPLRIAAVDAMYLARSGRWAELRTKVRERLGRS